ncbi:restriction endonuclease subunit S [Paraburkholderia sp. MM5384-R2]|uniref:restriction endonuclease subunit S n=1 Tax=Paraburkholderia sp. MM5384-R2 TaxID=2723097 RepID=UPI001616D65B|nr:restriction endonuclease subunit S [Paraburkholderia sp. MM5384-R2]MBB5496868.1 type I restriction enzyme S subunit [Paraburkholderia sp. MM5384-R2]
MSSLPEGWIFVNPLDAALPVRGLTYKKELAISEKRHGYTVVLRANNIKEDKLVFDDVLYLPDEIIQSQQLLRLNDILIAMSSGSISVVGKSAQVTNETNASFGAFCGVLRPNPQIDPRYLGLFLRSSAYRSAISTMARGVNINNLKWSHFESILFPLAPLAEQKRIADKLDAVLARVDAARERLERVSAVLKQFRRTVLAAATAGKLQSESQMSDDSRDGWITTELGSVAEVGTGSTPLRSNESFYTSEGTPWVTSSATSQRAVTRADEFVTADAIKAHRLKVYPIGTLLVAMYGEGKTRGQVTELAIPATINQACAAVRVNEKKADRRYVRLVLEANYFAMRELAEGGNQPNLNLSKIKSFPLLLPPLVEQENIICRVEALFAIANKIQAQYERAVERLDKLTPALLAKAFRGELVPQDPNDETAEKLLERLKAQTDLLASAGKRAKRSAKVVVD